MARRKGDSGSSERWLSAFDSATACAKGRHLRMLLVDITLILQNCSPFGLAHAVDFNDNLNTVFQKTGQSLVAAAHILRDERMFAVRFSGNSCLIRGLGLFGRGLSWECWGLSG